jgi:cell wall-associated NlpC family hydrolase
LKIPVKTLSYVLFAETTLNMRRLALPTFGLAMLLLAACSGPAIQQAPPETIAQAPRAVSHRGNDIALYALGLIDTGYRFGGKNPQAGLDCSGMVTHIYDVAVGLKLSGSAADLAKKSKPIERDSLRPGDLVFFNTQNRSFSHVGIFIGDARFVHAPATNGKVRIDRLNDRYYAQRFEAARTFFD